MARYGRRLSTEEFQSIVKLLVDPKYHHFDEHEDLVTGYLEGEPVIASYNKRAKEGWLFRDDRSLAALP